MAKSNDSVIAAAAFVIVAVLVVRFLQSAWTALTHW